MKLQLSYNLYMAFQFCFRSETREVKKKLRVTNNKADAVKAPRHIPGGGGGHSN